MLKWRPSCGICAVCYPEILFRKKKKNPNNAAPSDHHTDSAHPRSIALSNTGGEFRTKSFLVESECVVYTTKFVLLNVM